MSAGVYLTREELAALFSSASLGVISRTLEEERDAKPSDGTVFRLIRVLAATVDQKASTMVRNRFGEIVGTYRNANEDRAKWEAFADAVIAGALSQGEASKAPPCERLCRKCGTPFPAALLRAVDAEIAKVAAISVTHGGITRDGIPPVAYDDCPNHAPNVAACSRCGLGTVIENVTTGERTIRRLSTPAGTAAAELAAFDATLSAEQRASLAEGDAGAMTAEDAALLASKGMR